MSSRERYVDVVVVERFGSFHWLPPRQRLPPSEPENFILSLAGYGSINPEPNQAGRTILPVSRRLTFPPIELDIALVEQKREAAVITLLQQRLEDQDRGMVATPDNGHPAEPSRPKKAHKQSRKSRPTPTTKPMRSRVKLYSSGLNMHKESNLQLLSRGWRVSSERRAQRGRPQ